MAKKELKQMHNRTRFRAMTVHELTRQKKERAMDGLMFLTQKKSGDHKGFLDYNKKKHQRVSKQGGQVKSDLFCREFHAHLSYRFHAGKKCYLPGHSECFHPGRDAKDGERRTHRIEIVWYSCHLVG